MEIGRKRVDVGLAVRLVTEASPESEIAIVSTDTDLLPAFKEAKKKGARLLHIGYENRPIRALSEISHTTRIITLPVAQKFAGAQQQQLMSEL